MNRTTHPESREESERVAGRLVSRAFERETRGDAAETKPRDAGDENDDDCEHLESGRIDLHSSAGFGTPRLETRNEQEADECGAFNRSGRHTPVSMRERSVWNRDRGAGEAHLAAF